MKTKYIISDNILLCPLIITLFTFSGCNDFLDEKSDKQLVVMDRLEHLQALLDNPSYVNSNYCTAGEASSDNFFLSDETFLTLREEERNQYVWNGSHVFSETALTVNTWEQTYRSIYACTSILDAIEDIEKNSINETQWNSIKGQALAVRAFRYLDAALIWALAYDEQTASSDMGIPLRLDPDFNLPSVRASVAETYNQIITDAKASIPLLPVNDINAYRASKPFAYGLIARTYLAMRDYEQAGLYADSCLQLRNTLLDFNAMNQSTTYPFPRLNEETIFHGIAFYDMITINFNARIDQHLYESYADNDLRKVLFYSRNADSTIRFRGSYQGSATLFMGISTSEQHLIKAECLARLGRIDEAMGALNMLLEKRWRIGSFIPFSANTGEEALQLILDERRKELVMRGLRWLDLKRLNKEDANITLTRTVNGETHQLLPNDLRYALAIPEDVIALSGMPQNPR